MEKFIEMLFERIGWEIFNMKRWYFILIIWSECSSAVNGGDLGYFSKNQMQQQFEDVAFGLKPGELSGPVQSESGVHIIYRIAWFFFYK